MSLAIFSKLSYSFFFLFLSNKTICGYSCSGCCLSSPLRPVSLLTLWISEGFDSNIILIQRGGILRPKGDFPESLSQAMLVGCNVSRGIGRNAWPSIRGSRAAIGAASALMTKGTKQRGPNDDRPMTKGKNIDDQTMTK